MIMLVLQLILGLSICRKAIPRIIAWFNAGTTRNSTVYIVPSENWSGKCTIWWETTEELPAKCTSIGLKEYNKDYETFLLDLVTWAAAMKLCKAPLSISTFANTALNKTCNYINLQAKGVKTPGVET